MPLYAQERMSRMWLKKCVDIYIILAKFIGMREVIYSTNGGSCFRL